MKTWTVWLLRGSAVAVLPALMAACAPAASLSPTPVSAPAAATSPTPKAEAPTVAPAATKPAATPTPVPPTATPKPVTIKWGSPVSLSDSAIYTAIEKGYFKEQGITMEIITIASLSDQIPSLTNGDLDLANGGFAASIANAALRGIPVKIIADSGSNYPGFSYQAITIRKDLYDSGKIRTVVDLKGKKVSVTAVQTMSRYFAPLLAEAKMSVKDIDFVPLSFPDTVGAYANKSIDAAFQNEPILSQTISAGLAVRFKAVSEYRPGFQASVLLASPRFLQNKDVANRWMVAFVKGVRTYLETVNTGKGVDELIQTLMKYTPVKDRAPYDMMLKEKTLVGYNPNGYANKETLAADIDHFVVEGYIKEKVDINAIVDNSLVDYAVQVLGKK